MAKQVQAHHVEGIDQPFAARVSAVMRVEEKPAVFDDRTVRSGTGRIGVALLFAFLVADLIDVRDKLFDGSRNVVGTAERAYDAALLRGDLGLFGACRTLLPALLGVRKLCPVAPALAEFLENGIGIDQFTRIVQLFEVAVIATTRPVHDLRDTKRHIVGRVHRFADAVEQLRCQNARKRGIFFRRDRACRRKDQSPARGSLRVAARRRAEELIARKLRITIFEDVDLFRRACVDVERDDRALGDVRGFADAVLERPADECTCILQLTLLIGIHLRVGFERVVQVDARVRKPVAQFLPFDSLVRSVSAVALFDYGYAEGVRVVVLRHVIVPQNVWSSS